MKRIYVSRETGRTCCMHSEGCGAIGNRRSVRAGREFQANGRHPAPSTKERGIFVSSMLLTTLTTLRRIIAC
jgi:hypothetical protein